MRRALGIATLFALAAGGCTVEVTFDPIGQDVSLDGNWQLNGAAPDAASCAAADIDQVAVGFFDAGSTTPVFFGELTFPCSQGSFDTRPSAVLASGRYTTQWFALRDGANVGMGTMEILDVTAVTHATLRPVNFITTPGMFDPRGSDAQLTGDWSINGGAADATTCGDLGIANVEIWFYDEADTMLMDGVMVGTAGCAGGKFDSRPMPILRSGRYIATYKAIDSGGAVIAESDPFPPGPMIETLVVTTGVVMLAPVDFVTETTLETTLSWDQDDTATMVDGTCAMAGVATMTYTLSLGATMIEMMEDVACGDLLQFPGVAAGEYSLYAEGTDAMGRKLWMGTCDMLIVESGIEMYACFFDKMPPM